MKNNQWISIHTIGFDDELRWISNGKQNYDFEQHVYCVNLILVTQSSEKYSRKWGKVLVENSPGKFGKIWTTFLFVNDASQIIICWTFLF